MRGIHISRVLVFGMVVLGGFLPESQGALDDKYFTKTKTSANVYVSPYASDIRKIAILPFKAPTELAGLSVSDQLVTEILRSRRYTLVERGQMEQVLSESELALAGLSAASAVKVGEMLGAGGVVIGTVLEYGNVAIKGKTYPVVSVSARLIDTQSGEVVWSVDQAERADDRDATLTGQSHKVIHEMVAGLYQKWRKQKWVPRPDRSDAPSRDSGSSQDVYAPVGTRPGGAMEQGPAPVPLALVVSDFGLREVKLSWGTPHGEAADYLIERAQNEDGPFREIAKVAAGRRAYLDDGTRTDPLTDSTAYYYRVAVFTKDKRRGEYSEVMESLTAPPPDPPPVVRVTASSSRAVAIEWDPSPAEGVISYRVERTPAEEPEAFEEVKALKGTSWLDGGTEKSTLRDSTTYLYQVRAVNRVAAVGEPSEPEAVDTLPPPADIQGLVAEPNQVRCVPLTWEPSPEEDVVRYSIMRSDETDQGFLEIGQVKGRTTTSYLDGERDPGDLEDQATYTYKIFAHNDVGSRSLDAVPVEATTRPPPPVVTELTAETDGPREVSLQWDPSPDEKVTGYEIWRSPEEGEFALIGKTEERETSVYRDRGTPPRGLFGGSKDDGSGPGFLENAVVYRYHVKAFNTAYALSEPCEEVTSRTKDLPVAVMGMFTTTNTAGRVVLTWEANPEDDISHYEVEVADRPGSGFDTLTRVDAGVEDVERFAEAIGLDPSEARWFRVRAIDQAELIGLWSEAATGQAKPLPSTPESLEVHYGPEGAELSWQAAPQPDISAYRLYRKKFLGAEELRDVDEAAAQFTAKEVGKRITIAVSALDADGLESERSDWLELDGVRTAAGGASEPDTDPEPDSEATPPDPPADTPDEDDPFAPVGG